MSSFLNKIKSFFQNTVVRSILFFLLLGILLALVSMLLSKYFGPYINSAIPFLSQNMTLLLVVYFVYEVLQAFIAPLPSTPADIAIFAIAGPLVVFAINLSATLIGYSISYIIARKYGRSFLKKVLRSNTFEKVDQLSQNMNWKHFLTISLVPFNPPDLMPYAAGLSKIKFWTMIGILAFVIAIRLAFTLYVLNIFWIR